MRRLAALLTTALLLLPACTSRPHSNPFDPNNPDTGGRPAGFVALADRQSVVLRWQTAASPRLLGYQLFRLSPGDDTYRAVTEVMPPVFTSVRDIQLTDGATYRYRLYFVFDSGLGGLPAEDVATPGPLVPWVADFGGGVLARLSADGRRVAQILHVTGLDEPVAVDASPRDGNVWAVSPSGGVLVYGSGTGTQTLVGQQLAEPVSVVVDRQLGAAWVGDAANAQVVHLLPNGQPATPPQLGGLQFPGSLALDATNGSLWVVEQDGNRVSRYDATGARVASAVVPAPTAVAVDTVSHEAWVTSFENGSVLRLSSAGQPLDTIAAFSGPLGIAVDARHRRIWVADAAADQVVALAPNGTVQFRVRGLPEARAIAVDDSTGEAWVTLTAAGAVSRLSPAGQEIERAVGLTGPWGITLDNQAARRPPAPARAGAPRAATAAPRRGLPRL